MMAAPVQNFKIVLLGEGRVGKTSLLLRYVRNTYTENQSSTISASYLDKRLNIGSRTVHLSIWDTAGQERFHALGPIYYRDADGALLVYDVTDEGSFTKVKNWVKELRMMVGRNIAIVIAGNKIDLAKNRQISDEMAESYCQEVGATHVVTSAKINRGVEQAFLEVTKRMVANQERNPTLQKGSTSTLIITSPDQTAQKRSGGGCCS